MTKNEERSYLKEMALEVDGFVDGLEKAAGVKFKLPFDYKQMCICGLGASAIAGDIVADTILTRWNIPIRVIRSTAIPNWVNEDTLVIALSHSGNTKEALMMYDHAKAKRCRIIVMASGGELTDRCMKDGNMLIEMPAGIQPRSAAGYMIGYLLNIIESGGGPRVNSELKDLIPSLRTYKESIWMHNTESRAKHIAEKLRGTVPVIYASSPLSACAVRFRQQINENAKMIAFNGMITELEHSDIAGWSSAQTMCKPVLVYEEGASDTVIGTVNRMANILRSYGSEPEIIMISGKTALERSLRAVMLGDYVSLFLASMNRVDPMDVSSIKSFKHLLSTLLEQKGL
ncbi:MAG: bifunctional phosphoglucose/phosphomannose isomerase [Methanomassiliicoccaceae archaeon]|nr:bifunctional phosphoglucose/phosphomannose isomerase [Methanomassiliicoccaceae archaeon]